MKYSPLSDLLRKDNIKTDNQLMILSDSSWQDFPDIGRSIGSYIIFYQGGPIDHGTHVPGPVAQASAESEYSVSYTEGMVLANFVVLIHQFLTRIQI